MNYKYGQISLPSLINEEGHISFCSEYTFKGRHMQESIARDSLRNWWLNSPLTAVSRVLRKACSPTRRAPDARVTTVVGEWGDSCNTEHHYQGRITLFSVRREQHC